jgi:DNA-binding beta-propeller fold protein YncE
LVDHNEEGREIGRRRITVKARPIAMCAAHGRLFVVQAFVQGLLVLEAGSMRVLARLEVSDSQGMLAVAPDEESVYYAGNLERGFDIIDVRTLAARRVRYPPGGHGIGAVAVSPDGKRLYLAIQRGAREAHAAPPSQLAGPVNPLEQTYSGPLLAVYDLTRDEYVALASIGDTLRSRGDDSSIPTGLAFGPNGRKLYISMVQCSVGVHVFDTETNVLEKPLTFQQRGPATEPDCTDVLCGQGKLFVTLRSTGEVLSVDPESGKVELAYRLETPEFGQIRMAGSERNLYVCLTNGRRLQAIAPAKGAGEPSKAR